MSSAYGFGIATVSKAGAILDVKYKTLGLGKLADGKAPDLTMLLEEDQIRGIKKEVIAKEIDLAVAPKDAADAYLRLHLISSNYQTSWSIIRWNLFVAK